MVVVVEVLVVVEVVVDVEVLVEVGVLVVAGVPSSGMLTAHADTPLAPVTVVCTDTAVMPGPPLTVICRLKAPVEEVVAEPLADAPAPDGVATTSTAKPLTGGVTYPSTRMTTALLAVVP